MNYISAVGITVGLLAGAWVFASGALGFIAFAGFLGWATYFAAGGKLDGMKKALCCNIAGVFWGVVTIFISGLIPNSLGLVITILVAAIMCWQAKISFLSFIPGTFIGNAAFYATDCNGIGALLGLVIGIMLGYISDIGAQKLAPKSTALPAENGAEKGADIFS